MKKFKLGLLVAFMCACMIACGNEDSAKDKGDDKEVVSKDKDDSKDKDKDKKDKDKKDKDEKDEKATNHFSSNEENIIGLVSISYTDEYVAFEIDESKISNDRSHILDFKNNLDDVKTFVNCHKDGDVYANSPNDVIVDTTKKGFKIKLYCDEPSKIDRVMLDMITIRYFETPEINEMISDGNGDEYFVQNFNSSTNSWDEFEYIPDTGEFADEE